MRKALAQNPNLLRTLMGMGLTLIFLLAYAVYGATIDTEYFIYKSESNETQVSLDTPEHYFDEDSNSTTWTWDAAMNGVNLTWINVTASSLSEGATLSVSNAAGIYSHPDLGDVTAEEFSCMVSCVQKNLHTVVSEDGNAEIISLTDPNPALRGTGTVYADSIGEARDKAKGLIETEFEPAVVRITVTENGNRTVSPSIKVDQVNENLSEIKPFEIDTATEFVWALAAVIGCFSLVLIPSFTVYFAARAKQKKVEMRLEAAKDALEES
ncbi:MAG: hypothetical protein HOE76_01300 [Euryarchaeota archaeon]|nr:hypothetical protein [Euryarchaeota archaeon]MBT4981543.1 hypothetical protein [Euryarchaeota archaeon]